MDDEDFCAIVCEDNFSLLEPDVVREVLVGREPLNVVSERDEGVFLDP